MIRLRRLSIALLLGLLMVATAGVAGAAPNKPKGPKQDKLRMEWSVRRVVQTVTPGQSVTVPVTLTSSVDVANVVLRPVGGVARVVTISPAGPLTLKAGVPVALTLTLSLPADAAHGRAGVVQVRVGNRNVPASLKLWIAPPNAASDDDTDDDTSGTAGQGAANGKHNGKAGKPDDKGKDS